MTRAVEAIERKRRRFGAEIDRTLELAHPHVVHLTSANLDFGGAQESWRRFDRYVRDANGYFGFARVIARTANTNGGYHVHAVIGGFTPGWRPHYRTLRGCAKRAGFGKVATFEEVVVERSHQLREYLLEHIDDRHVRNLPVPPRKQAWSARTSRTLRA